MMSEVSKIKAILIALALLACLASVSSAAWLGNWGPKTINAANGVDDLRNCLRNGPIVVALRPADRDKSVIVWDASHIYVLEPDGSTRFTIAIPDEDYTFEYSPAVGDVVEAYEQEEGAGYPYQEIVAAGTKYSGQRKMGMLWVFSGLDGHTIASLDMSPGNSLMPPGTPVLVDIESSIEGQFEDFNMEILIGNYQYLDQKSYLTCYDVAWEGENIVISATATTSINIADADRMDDIANRMPAVADFDKDGLKEIVYATSKRVVWWTYDPSNEENHFDYRNSKEFVSQAGEQEYGIYGAVGPIIADIDNDGKLWAILPLIRQPHQDEWGEGKLIVLDITGNAWAGVEHPSFDATGGLDDSPEIFPDGVGFRSDMGAVGDFEDGEYNPDGKLLIAMDMGAPSLIQPVQNSHTVFALQPTNAEGYWLSIGKIGPQGNVDYRLCLNYFGANNEERAFNITEGQNSQPLFSEELDGVNSGFGGNVIADLYHDKTIDILYRTTDSNGNLLRIYAMSTASNYGSNELELIEWSQLQNGPRHTGLYAQIYPDDTGKFPAGSTTLRDRVILTDDVEADEDHVIVTTHNHPSVIEFNPGVTLTINQNAWGIATGPYGLVMKGNHAGDNWHFVLVQDDQFEYPQQEPGEGEDLSVTVKDGDVTIGDGAELTLNDWHFIGDGASTAVTSSGGIVNLTNCTFSGYSTALSLDGCTGTISNCTFENCTATAIELYDCSSDLSIDSCTIQNNDGAGIYLYNSNALIRHNNITGNNGGSLLSAVYSYTGSPHFRNNDIHGNERIGLLASGGGVPDLTTYNGSDPHRNRFSENNTSYPDVR
jgi:parallel beta-helix repeat protein